ncbi:MAG TPA: MiaB/RimO family radical SAM methylthiotransferase [Longimicrobiales bacterium]|nr:MiaB/RimO family radical SAM methylthiotransferase [Longimicrobiales bacterium]
MTIRPSASQTTSTPELTGVDRPSAPQRTPRKAYVETYGCQMNQSDGELMQGVLAAHGYEITHSPEGADVVLVNTCAIREHAEQRVIGRVGELSRLKREKPDLVIGVTGCMAQRLGTQLLEKAPYVDLVMGPDGYRSLATVIEEIGSESERGARAVAVSQESDDAVAEETGEPLPTGTLGVSAPGQRARRALPVLDAAATEYMDDGRVAVLAFDADEHYEGIPIRRAAGVSAWVSVQRGCDHRCTYCIVPYVRGPEKNRDPAMVLREVRDVAEQGITEVTLLGQTVNSYVHGDWSFARLLREVARVDGIRRVRFMSPHPRDVTPELVEVMATEPHVCRQLHLPAQSGSDRVLKRMVRRYTVDEFLSKVEMVRAAMPDIALSTDIIVAFPGETDDEYEATLDLMRTVRFDDAYLYRYSLRDGTPATRLPEAQFIPDDVAQSRLERLIELHRDIQSQINREEVGSTVEVLVERAAKSAGDMLGRTERNKVVAFPGGASLIGKYLSVRLTSTTGATFRGRLLEAAAVA